MGKYAPGEPTDDPEAVDDGCGLLPYVPRSLVTSIAVSRIVYSGEGPDTFEMPLALPRRFMPDDDETTIAEFCGGGFFQAQARDAAGRFLRGYPVRRFAIDGPEKVLTTGDGAEGMPPGPPAPPTPPAPREAPLVAAPAVPLVTSAEGLAGMPRALLDIPGLNAEQRSFMAPFMAMLAYANHSWTRALDVSVRAAQDGAAAEKAAADAAVTTAKLFVEKVTGPAVLQQGEAVKELSRELGELRANRDAIATELRQVREERETARVEVARLTALLESGGQLPPKPTGFGATLQAIVGMVLQEFGPPAAGIVAARLGVTEDQLRALTAGGRGPDTRPDDRAVSSA